MKLGTSLAQTFAALKERINPPVFEDFSNPKDIKNYTLYTDISYRTLRRLALKDLPHVRDFGLISKGPEFKIIYNMHWSASIRTDAGDEYPITFDNKTINAGALFCNKRDRTLGRLMFANRVRVGLALGFNMLELNAAAEMGAYVWARAGVYVAPHHKATLRQHLHDRLKHIKPLIDDAIWHQASALADMAAPTDLKKLADLRTPVPHIKDLFNGPIKPLITVLLSYDGSFDADKFCKRGFLQQGPNPLGKVLLLGEDYDAYVDLCNKTQLATLSAYTNTNLLDYMRTKKTHGFII